MPYLFALSNDFQYLILQANDADIATVRTLIGLITSRGYNRNKDLQKDLDGYIDQFSG